MQSYQGWIELGSLLQGNPVGVREFSNVVGEFNEVIKESTKGAGIANEGLLKIERDLVIRGTIPDCYQKALETLCGPILNKLLDTIQEPGRVMFAPEYWEWHCDDQREGGSTCSTGNC